VTENDSTSYNSDTSYGIPTPSSYSVADGTPITVTIATFNGQDGTGGISYVSTVVFACDTGNVISLQSGLPPPTSVPTMTEWGMIIFVVLAGFGSIYYLRRQKRANS